MMHVAIFNVRPTVFFAWHLWVRRMAEPGAAAMLFVYTTDKPLYSAERKLRPLLAPPDETQRSAQEQAEATQDQAAEAAESIIRAAHENAAAIKAAAQARIAITESEIQAKRTAHQQATFF